jgi:hypothetical protein
MKKLTKIASASCLVGFALLFALASAQIQPQSQAYRPEVRRHLQHDLSPSLRSIARPPERQAKKDAEPVRLLPITTAPIQKDSAEQSAISPSISSSSGLNFAGIGYGDYGYSPYMAPPDTNIAVGAAEIVQWVNGTFAVFDKITGAILFGPVAGNSIWSGFGGGCEQHNDGDPIVQYDKLNQRWIFSQISGTATPYLQCIAVSTTPDATGTYNRYAFEYGDSFGDYPKLGVWPDAYYISFNEFGPTAYLGAKVCAYDSAAMRAGGPATQVCFQLDPTIGGLMPADLDGLIPPPFGSPNFLVNLGTNSLNLWKFHVDFIAPSNSTLVGPTSILVAPFTPACGWGGSCIPQPATKQMLDTMGDRLMYRLAYRNFGNHESLVVNHSVMVPGSRKRDPSTTSVRWYELRNPNGNPFVFQQGTLSTADKLNRWMGSIAME